MAEDAMIIEISIHKDVVELLDELISTIDANSKDGHTSPSNIQTCLVDEFRRCLDSTSDCSSSSTGVSSSSEDESPKTKKKTILTKVQSVSKQTINEDNDDDDDDEDGGDEHMKADDSGIKKDFCAIKFPKTKDELCINELLTRPIEKINITIGDDVKLVKLGKVISIIEEKLVVIDSLISSGNLNSAPLDEETILFDSKRQALGKIFETFGPVTHPFYSVRFSSGEIVEKELDLAVDSFVFYAPGNQAFTKFIFNVKEMRQIRGSDASYLNDNEPPTNLVDYSDDEQEKEAKKIAKLKARANKEQMDSSDDDEDMDEDKPGTGPFDNRRKKVPFKKSQSTQFNKQRGGASFKPNMSRSITFVPSSNNNAMQLEHQMQQSYKKEDNFQYQRNPRFNNPGPPSSNGFAHSAPFHNISPQQQYQQNGPQNMYTNPHFNYNFHNQPPPPQQPFSMQNSNNPNYNPAYNTIWSNNNPGWYPPQQNMPHPSNWSMQQQQPPMMNPSFNSLHSANRFQYPSGSFQNGPQPNTAHNINQQPFGFYQQHPGYTQQIPNFNPQSPPPPAMNPQNQPSPLMSLPNNRLGGAEIVDKRFMANKSDDTFMKKSY